MLYRITIAYDGTDFEGWQLQSRARQARTVQGVLEAALLKLSAGKERVSVKSAGRTDAGVHAEGQVASFELPKSMGNEELASALNGLLPGDVRVLDASPAPEGFDPRKASTSKVYRYVLDTGRVQLPTRRRFAGHVPRPLDKSAVKAASRLYVGRHDFASVASAGGSATTTTRTLVRSDASFSGETFVYEVEGDGFLRKMVRSLVGGLIAAGLHTLSVEELALALEARDRRRWPAPASARGLTLVRVNYPSLTRC